MTQNAKMQKTKMSVFVQNGKKPKMGKFTFEPSEIQNRETPQNDRLNLSFEKDEHTDGKEMARNGCTRAIYESVSFRIRVYLGEEQVVKFKKSYFLGTI